MTSTSTATASVGTVGRMGIFKVVATLITTVSLLSMVSVESVQAISVRSKPSRPEITKITTSKSSMRGKVNVTVRFTRAETNGRRPLLRTIVTAGGKSCEARKSRTKCTLRNVGVGQRLNISALAQNKNGNSRRSKRISFRVRAGAKWERTVPLRFDLKNSTALFLVNEKNRSINKTSGTLSQSDYGLYSLNNDFTISNAVSSGLLGSQSSFYIAPNDKLYVSFNPKTIIGDVSCLLAEVEKVTGIPTCIESDMLSLTDNFGSGINRSTNPSVQTDDEGAIYYAGTSSRGGNFVLKKYLNGISTSLITEDMRLLDMMVLGDGFVLISGETSGSRWLKRISPSGNIDQLADDQSYWMRRFHDGNIYFGLYEFGQGVKRYLVAQHRVEDRSWIANASQGAVNPYNESGALCSYGWVVGVDGFCTGNQGVYLKSFLNTPRGETFVIAGSWEDRSYGHTLMKFFPTLVRPSINLEMVGAFTLLGEKILVSGSDSSGQFQTILYDSDTDSSELFSSSMNNYDVTELVHVISTQSVVFSGKNVGTGKYLLGKVDVLSGVLTVLLEDDVPVKGLQAFNL